MIGGHSIIDPEIKYGMAVTGVIHPDRIIRNIGVQEGDALVLTKPLGTGIITTTLKQRRECGRGRGRRGVDGDAQCHRSRIMCRYRVHACSDVTGFGLLGHAQEMASGSDVTIVLDSSALPLLPARRELAEAGHLTGGCKRNRAYLEDKVGSTVVSGAGLVEVAFDPQTSGGLLIAVPADDAPLLVQELRANGVSAATIVGHATPRQTAAVRLV